MLVGGVENYIIRLHELYLTRVSLRCLFDVNRRPRAGQHVENLETSRLTLHSSRALTYTDETQWYITPIPQPSAKKLRNP